MADPYLIVDTRSLTRLAKDFRDVGAALRLELPKATAEEAQAIADHAKEIAGSYPTQGSGETTGMVVNSIRVRARGPETYAVEAGGEEVPLAGLWELGNRGSPRDSATFRHPVFGRGSVTQRKWPFLEPAARAAYPTMVARVIAKVGGVLRRFRL